jgi:SAM-dependent methyltransferase
MIFFKDLQWSSNKLIYNNYVFRLEHFKDIKWEHDDSYFTFYKVKGLVDEYENFFSKAGDFKCTNLLEIGVFKGGSMPFWNELLGPEKHIGVDLIEITSTAYLDNYLNEKRKSGKAINYYGKIDQSDKNKLLSICSSEFKEPLDLVIDDASHLYDPTKASFEAMFPLLRPGGLYIIEDWAWGHWEEFFLADNFWANEVPPTKLITELIEFVGTDRNRNIVRSLAVYEGFVVLERGDFQIASDEFELEKFIKRRPVHPKPSPILRKVKRLAKKVLGRK